MTLRGSFLGYHTELKDCVRLFNQENNEWYVVLEEGGSAVDYTEYAKRTSVEIGAGQGPDILFGDVLQDYVVGVLQKGGFADLSPYLEESGMKEDSFFPWAFGCYRDGEEIYSVVPWTDFSQRGHYSILMDAAVLGTEDEPDIEMLMDSLLDIEEGKVFMLAVSSDELLDLFLEGSESLWGMVDWEKRTCSFDTALFHKIMEAAKRFGDSRDPRSLQEELRHPKDGEALAKREYYNMYMYHDQELLREKGKVQVGIMFDDGCHACPTDTFVLMINVNSQKKEGAWEFIKFLLEEVRPTSQTTYPSTRKVFDEIMEAELEKKLYVEESYSDSIPLTEARIQGIREVLEGARFLPLSTKPILDIIHEEAQAYFSGSKNIEEICAIIENRVQVYLDEG